MVKRKLDRAMDESSVDREIRKSDTIVQSPWKIWRPAPAELGLMAGRQYIRRNLDKV